MADLRRVEYGGRDCWRLRVYIRKKRETIGLGSMDDADAEIAKSHIEHLVEVMHRDRPPDKKTTRWLDDLSSDVFDRLAELGLVEPRAIQDHPRTVVAFMRAYIVSRTDWKKSVNHKQSVDHLEAYLGRDVPLRALTKGDADRFHRWMMEKRKLSPNTAGQHIKRCRQMMRSAVDDRLIEMNPFQGIRIDLRSDKSKNRFISEADAKALLACCPDQEWRVLFALARYGGLRCPSEVLALRWSDIAWDRGRFKVRSSKTEKAGKAERIVPLFPELREELDALFAQVQPGMMVPANAYVIQSYRCTEVNLRKALLSIADLAGVERWPKPFMALRSSRRTELERSKRFANHVLNAWFGHTEKIADEHYLQTTEDDYKEATDSVIPLVIPSLGNQESPKVIKKSKNPGKRWVLMDGDTPLGASQYTHLDSNQKPSVP